MLLPMSAKIWKFCYRTCYNAINITHCSARSTAVFE